MTHETGTPMTAKRALALYQNTSGWLLAAVEQERTCHCGACHLCAYYFFRDALARLREEDNDDIIYGNCTFYALGTDGPLCGHETCLRCGRCRHAECACPHCGVPERAA